MNLKNSKIYILPAIIVGALGPWVVENIYTSSIIYLSVLVFLSIFLEEYAFIILGAYVLSDVLVFIKSRQEVGLWFVAGQLSKYILLYSLVITLPRLARTLGEIKTIGRAPLKKFIHAAVAAALTYLWCQAAIVLIRPVFVWSYDEAPSIEATESVQKYFYYLMVSALSAILIRYKYSEKHLTSESVTKSTKMKFIIVHPFWRMFIVVPFIWLLLAGMYTHWFDWVMAFVVIFIYESGLFENWILPLRPSIKFLERIHPILKFFGGFILSYAISYLILKITSENQNFRPVLFGTLLSLGIFFILFPRNNYYFKKKVLSET